MKKIISAFLAVLIIACSAVLTDKAYADVIEFKLNYDVSSAMLLEYETGKVLYAYNETKHVPIASITKVMTLILAFEAIENGTLAYDQMITVSSDASAMGGSGVFLYTGEQVSVADLFKAIIVASANDACVAMAETIAGSQAQFVAMMNTRAGELGMADTNFVNCTGLPDTGYYSCARDVAVMSRELMSHEDYFRWSSIWLDTMDNIQNKTVITNTNKLVRFYKGCDGTKTGFTNDAMHCISASAKRGGVRFIAIVLGAKSSEERFSLAKELLNYGFANYKTHTVAQKGQSFDGSTNLRVRLGRTDYVNGVTAESVSELTEIQSKSEYTVTSVPDDYITAPVLKGDKIGYYIIYKNNEELARVDMLAESDVERLSYKDYISRLFSRLVWCHER